MALSSTPYAIDPGVAFAQMVIHHCNLAVPRQVTSLDATERGIGFGSSDTPELDIVTRPALSAVGILKKRHSKTRKEGRPDSGDLVSCSRAQSDNKLSESEIKVTPDHVHIDDDAESTTEVIDDDAETAKHEGPIPMQIALSTYSGRRQYTSILAQT